MRLPLLFCFFFCLPLFLTSAPPPDFYVWQRGGALPEKDPRIGRFYVWAGELERAGTRLSTRSFATGTETPVIRIHSARMDDPDLADRLVRWMRQSNARSLQIDCDVPERKLASYGATLRDLRRRLGKDTELSATVLPCHLTQEKEFSAAVEPLDFYVLQLHGIDVPRQANDSYALMDGNVCRAAIAAARRLGKPFRLAFPTYGYRLFFNRADGAFLGLNAEGGVPTAKKDVLVKLAVPDKSLIAALRRENPDLAAMYFRYPAATDRLNFDLETVLALDRGETPPEAVSVAVERAGKGAFVLNVTNCGLMDETPRTVELTWKSRKGEALLFAGTRDLAPGVVYGILPYRLSVPMPPCGETTAAARFLCEEAPQKVEIVP